MFSSSLSNFSEGVNTAFIIILSILFFFLIALTIVLVLFIIKYRESKHPIAAQFTGNRTLEIIWTIIPLILVLAMYYFGWTAWKPMESKPPADSMHIKTVARMWKWNFNYENGIRTDTLIIPVGKPVALDMEAIDVIHSLYIPAFRLKKDVVPGTPRTAWFIANSPGTYDLFCTEYCGLEHSSMITSVKVLTQEEFNKWYTDTAGASSILAGNEPSITPMMKGRQIVQQIGCNACHSIDGTKIIGPSYLSIFGHEVTVITKGQERKIIADEEYLRKSILEPDADIVKGYSKGLMLSYKDQLTGEELEQIIEYIKSVQ